MDSNSAKVNAILRAYQLIVSKPSLASRNVVIISDSKAAVSWVNGEGFGNLKLVNLVYDIRIFILNFKGVLVLFKPRGSSFVQT